MFTGIIEAKGRVTSSAKRGALRAVSVRLPASWSVQAGQSVAVDGICLTAVKSAKGRFAAELMGETLRKTAARAWKTGTVVNLERALRFGDRMDGHLVLGHIEGVATIAAVVRDGASRRITLTLPLALARRVREKGSLAVNGVSLTVAQKRGTRASVALVPYTLSHTNLGTLRVGDTVNLETDALTGGRVVPNATRRIGKRA